MKTQSEATQPVIDEDPESRRPLLERLILRQPIADVGDRMRYGGGVGGFPKCDEPTPERRARIRVTLPGVHSGLQLPNGFVVGGPGTTEIYCSASDHRKLLESGLVAGDDEPERLRAAAAHFESAIFDEMREAFGGIIAADESTDPAIYESLTRKQIAAMLRDKHPDAIACRKAVMRETQASLQRSYQTLHETSVPPISKVELLETIDAPKSIVEQERQATADLHDSMMARQFAPVVQALTDAVRELRATVDTRKGK